MVLSKDLKLAICFGLIMGAIISVFNMCFAAEDVELLTADNLGWSNTTNGADGVFTSGSYTILYFPVEPGYVYHLEPLAVSTSVTFSGCTNEVPSIDVDYFNGNRVSFNGTISFTGGSFGYMFFAYTDQSASGREFIVTRDALPGMTGFVDNLAYDLSYANLSGVLFFVVPIMAIAVLVGLGFYLLKRLLNKIKRAKGGA